MRPEFVQQRWPKVARWQFGFLNFWRQIRGCWHMESEWLCQTCFWSLCHQGVANSSRVAARVWCSAFRKIFKLFPSALYSRFHLSGLLAITAQILRCPEFAKSAVAFDTEVWVILDFAEPLLSPGQLCSQLRKWIPWDRDWKRSQLYTKMLLLTKGCRFYAIFGPIHSCSQGIWIIYIV